MPCHGEWRKGCVVGKDVALCIFLRNIVTNATAFNISAHAFVADAIAFFAIHLSFSLNRFARNTNSTCFFARAGVFKTERGRDVTSSCVCMIFRLLHVTLRKRFASHVVFFKLNIVDFWFSSCFFKSMLRNNALCVVLFMLLSADCAIDASAFSLPSLPCFMQLCPLLTHATRVCLNLD